MFDYIMRLDRGLDGLVRVDCSNKIDWLDCLIQTIGTSEIFKSRVGIRA